MKKLKYACIGTGGIADQKHLAGYAQLDDVELVAICGRNQDAARRLAEKYGVPHIYADEDAMFEAHPELDIVSVCTPNFMHCGTTIKALEKGINVHCEKPLCMSEAEAREIAAAEEKSRAQVMVAFNQRFTNNAWFLKRCIEDGLFGDIYHVKCGYRRTRGIPGKGGWFTNKALSGGGPLIDLGVHFLDLAMYLLDFPKAKTATGATYAMFADNGSRNSWQYGGHSDGLCDVEDLAAGFLRFERGITVDFEFSWASNIEKEYNYCEILGTKSGARLYDGTLTLYSECQDTLVKIQPDTNYPIAAINEFRHFCDCVREGRTPLATVEQSVRLMQVIDAVYRSAELGREVDLAGGA